MVIFVNELVECKLKIITLIDGMKSVELIKGRGYCKKEDSFLVVYFTSDNIKYKYEYDGEKLIVFCNDSKYCFISDKKSIGKIKNGDYIFEITTFASKIDVNENCIILNYELFQNNILIGNYETSLLFELM